MCRNQTADLKYVCVHAWTVASHIQEKEAKVRPLTHRMHLPYLFLLLLLFLWVSGPNEDQGQKEILDQTDFQVGGV